MSALTDLHDKLAKAVENTEGWILTIKDHLPAVAAAAQKYENSPIVQALENAVLPPSVEQEIANLIAKAGEEFAKTSATTTAAAPPASTDTTTAPAASA
jgi:hypothetical protein